MKNIIIYIFRIYHVRLSTPKKGTIILHKDRYRLAKNLVDMTGERKCIHTLNKSIYKRAIQKRRNLYLL